MRNLNPYAKNTIDFYDLVIKRKHNPKDDKTYKDRMTALRAQIDQAFIGYEELFNANQLINSVSVGFVNQNKADLLNLYSYKSKTIQELKVEVTTLENNRILNTCQNCTINEVNSFDHYLPKDEFPEFVVNPKNLIPSCTACNSFKTTIWKEIDRLVFLNIYLNTLPNFQYLFVNVTAAGNAFNTEFYLENRDGINESLYNLIKSHYQKLKLCERFSLNNNTVVTNLENSISSNRHLLSRADIVATTEDKINRDKRCFGQNHWKSILEQELIHSNIFMDRLFI